MRGGTVTISMDMPPLMMGPGPSHAAVMGSLVRMHQDLASAPILWLSTTRPDGRPHIVPTWFDWDGEVITVFSKTDAQKVRNVRHQPAVMVALGRPELDFAVELLEGEAVVVDPTITPGPPATALPSPRFVRKYATAFADAGYTADSFAAAYTVTVRIRLTRLLDWGSRGTRYTADRLAPGA
jgi:PPOX class probable F420-dependent enzyme